MNKTNEFDTKASGWDQSQMHRDRAAAIAEDILKTLPLNRDMKVLEYGAGTGLTSFILKDRFSEITMLDNSDGMLAVLNEKITASGASNLKALKFDLEKENWPYGKFDLILTQMVLHHVSDIDTIISKFSKMLNQGGYIAIADLYTEDGSFHGEGFTGHNGFDPDKLGQTLRSDGFTSVDHHKCFVVNKHIGENKTRPFDVFLLTAKLS